MSFVLVAPEILDSAAANITQIGSTVGADNLAAAIPTIPTAAAAPDEVSAAIAAVFGTHAKEYQAAAALAATYHAQFVRRIERSGGIVSGTEAPSTRPAGAAPW